MLKEAIEKIEELAKPTILEVDGKTFAVDCGGHATQILAPLFYPERKDLSSLDALTLMIREEAVPSYGKIFVNIPSPTCVHAFLSPNPDLREERMTIYRADATDVPGWEEETRLAFDKAAVALQTRFQESDDRREGYIQRHRRCNNRSDAARRVAPTERHHPPDCSAPALPHVPRD